jgi:signal transduction histidine kinase
VADEGPGLEASEYDRLFDLFYRSPANERRASGTGIGLFVVRELVVAMGGRVAGVPNVPRGSRFTVHLPLFEPAGIDQEADDDALVEPALAAEA